MTETMQTVADALPSAVPAITDPWLGVSNISSHLAVLGAWAAVGLVATGWLARRAAA